MFTMREMTEKRMSYNNNERRRNLRCQSSNRSPMTGFVFISTATVFFVLVCFSPTATGLGLDGTNLRSSGGRGENGDVEGRSLLSTISSYFFPESLFKSSEASSQQQQQEHQQQERYLKRRRRRKKKKRPVLKIGRKINAPPKPPTVKVVKEKAKIPTVEVVKEKAKIPTVEVVKEKAKMPTVEALKEKAKMVSSINPANQIDNIQQAGQTIVKSVKENVDFKGLQNDTQNALLTAYKDTAPAIATLANNAVEQYGTIIINNTDTKGFMEDAAKVWTENEDEMNNHVKGGQDKIQQLSEKDSPEGIAVAVANIASKELQQNLNQEEAQKAMDLGAAWAPVVINNVDINAVVEESSKAAGKTLMNNQGMVKPAAGQTLSTMKNIFNKNVNATAIYKDAVNATGTESQVKMVSKYYADNYENNVQTIVESVKENVDLKGLQNDTQNALLTAYKDNAAGIATLANNVAEQYGQIIMNNTDTKGFMEDAAEVWTENEDAINNHVKGGQDKIQQLSEKDSPEGIAVAVANIASKELQNLNQEEAQKAMDLAAAWAPVVINNVDINAIVQKSSKATGELLSDIDPGKVKQAAGQTVSMMQTIVDNNVNASAIYKDSVNAAVNATGTESQVEMVSKYVEQGGPNLNGWS